MRDPDFVEARCTISILQTALDRATARVRELETINAALNVRLTVANDRHDELESVVAFAGDVIGSGTRAEVS